MKNNSHTPGPWRIDFRNVGKIIEVQGPDRIVIHEMDYGSIPDGVSNFNEIADEITSNARLISAAPEMLEALIEFVAWAEKTARWDKTEGAYYKAKAAIDKANGIES